MWSCFGLCRVSLAVLSRTAMSESKRGPSAAAATRNSRLQFAASDLE